LIFYPGRLESSIVMGRRHWRIGPDGRTAALVLTKLAEESSGIPDEIGRTWGTKKSGQGTRATWRLRRLESGSFLRELVRFGNYLQETSGRLFRSMGLGRGRERRVVSPAGFAHAVAAIWRRARRLGRDSVLSAHARPTLLLPWVQPQRDHSSPRKSQRGKGRKGRGGGWCRCSVGRASRKESGSATAHNELLLVNILPLASSHLADIAREDAGPGK